MSVCVFVGQAGSLSYSTSDGRGDGGVAWGVYLESSMQGDPCGLPHAAWNRKEVV